MSRWIGSVVILDGQKRGCAGPKQSHYLFNLLIRAGGESVIFCLRAFGTFSKYPQRRSSDSVALSSDRVSPSASDPFQIVPHNRACRCVASNGLKAESPKR